MGVRANAASRPGGSRHRVPGAGRTAGYVPPAPQCAVRVKSGSRNRCRAPRGPNPPHARRRPCPAPWCRRRAGRGFMRPSSSVLSQRFVHYPIVFPVSSAGGDAPAMRGHRQAFPTPRGATGGCPPGYGMRGTPPRPPASSRAACDAPASRRAALLAGNLATPSYGYNLADTGH